MVIIGRSLFLYTKIMESREIESEQAQTKMDKYSVWALPPEDVTERLTKLMSCLRSEFGGPEFEPHLTVVGAINLTESDARNKLQWACEGLKAYTASVDRVATGMCVYLLLHPTPEIMKVSARCSDYFGYKRSRPYIPHIRILYGDLTDEEQKKAQERAQILDDSISSISFQITRLALYKTDPEDKSLKSWEKIAECNLNAN